MRLTLLLTLVASVAGCDWPTATSGSTGDSSPDAGAVCSQTGGCTACTACAIGGPCAALYSACEQDPECMSIDQCFQSCAPGDATCEQTCYANDPTGASEYMAVTSCVDCTECPTACGLCSQ